ncbi:lamin tail domain-containing protein [Streptomyces luteolifulvus]|uniref:Lamin tail domain-containing protein n=1 Tax=Streptomyces luteolifulvus TaxID=2615112 RepID=A0A6H9US24_9ACTN|nr:lamin tail domain-containing protein [Streptomyces luteolifulvus]KAB1142052.1 lamin tail domain-containing protein [Streptomyces luteolifulvus]
MLSLVSLRLRAALPALAGAALLTGTLLSSPAQAAGSVHLSKVYYDSPGSPDSGSNTSLNGEWVRIKNSTSSTVSLKGWKIKDETGYTYTFGDVRIGSGASKTVHTGKGTNTGAHKYWGRSWYVWNNTGDTAKLYKANGTKVDSCSWSSRGSGYKYC